MRVVGAGAVTGRLVHLAGNEHLSSVATSPLYAPTYSIPLYCASSFTRIDEEAQRNGRAEFRWERAEFEPAADLV